MATRSLENTVVYVYGDDWCGMYVKGDLKTQNHSLRVRDVLDALGVDYKSLEVNPDWLDENGQLPDRIEDVDFK